MERATPCSSCTPCSVAVGGRGPQKGAPTPGLRASGRLGVRVSRFSWLWPQLIEDRLEKRNLGRRDWGACQSQGLSRWLPRPLALISPKVSQCLLPGFLTGFQKQLLELLLVLGAAQFCAGRMGGRPPVRRVEGGSLSPPALPKPDPLGSTGQGP